MVISAGTQLWAPNVHLKVHTGLLNPVGPGMPKRRRHGGRQAGWHRSAPPAAARVHWAIHWKLRTWGPLPIGVLKPWLWRALLWSHAASWVRIQPRQGTALRWVGRSYDCHNGWDANGADLAVANSCCAQWAAQRWGSRLYSILTLGKPRIGRVACASAPSGRQGVKSW